MRVRYKSAIGRLAAALMTMGSAALAADAPVPSLMPSAGGGILRPAQAKDLADNPNVQQAENPKVEQAEESLEAEKEDDTYAPKAYLTDLLIGKCLAEKTGLFVNGYVVQSFTANAWSPSDRTNGPVTFNDRSNDYLMNQAYLSLGRNVDTSGDRIDFGARVDYFYGSDAIFTQAYGLESAGNPVAQPGIPGHPSWDGGSPIYRQALPQAYGQIWLPILKGIDIKIGHFYTLIGYEVVTTPDNFFTTLPYTFQYGEPFTHTGVMASTKLSDKLIIHTCLVRGWDNWTDSNTQVGFLGGFAWTPSNKTNVTLNMITSPEQDNINRYGFQGVRQGAIGAWTNRTLYSLVIQQKLSDKLKYVFQHDHGFQDPNPNVGNTTNAQWYGINQYLFYEFNKKWSVGARAEWFRDDDGVRVGEARYTSSLGPQAFDPSINPVRQVPFGFGGTPFASAGANYYEVTLGLNWKPTPNIIIRPDCRWDWQTRDAGAIQATPAYNDNTRSQQFITSLNIITKF